MGGKGVDIIWGKGGSYIFFISEERISWTIFYFGEGRLDFNYGADVFQFGGGENMTYFNLRGGVKNMFQHVTI